MDREKSLHFPTSFYYLLKIAIDKGLRCLFRLVFVSFLTRFFGCRLWWKKVVRAAFLVEAVDKVLAIIYAHFRFNVLVDSRDTVHTEVQLLTSFYEDHLLIPVYLNSISFTPLCGLVRSVSACNKMLSVRHAIISRMAKFLFYRNVWIKL